MCRRQISVNILLVVDVMAVVEANFDSGVGVGFNLNSVMLVWIGYARLR